MGILPIVHAMVLHRQAEPESGSIVETGDVARTSGDLHSMGPDQ